MILNNFIKLLIKKIHISQGLASVIQGHESIPGQINVELKNPDQENNLFINLYTNSFLAKQGYIDHSFKLGKWQSLFSVSVKSPANKIDENKDNFIDIPEHTEYSIYNKWVYREIDNLYFSGALRYTSEEIIGGNPNFNKDYDKGSSDILSLIHI